MSSRKARSRAQLKEMLREFAQSYVRPAEDNHDLDVFKEQTLMDLSKNRADTLLIEGLDLPRDELEIGIAEYAPTEASRNLPLHGRVIPYIYCTLKKEDAKDMYVQGRYEEAIELYKSAMRVYMGEDAVLPSPTYINETYMAIDPMDIRRMMDLAACASNIAQCYIKLGKLIEVSS